MAQKINPYSVARFVALLLAAMTLYCAAAGRTIFSSSTEKIVVSKEQQIAQDPAPEAPLQRVADSSWEPLDPGSGTGKYDNGNWLLRATVFIRDSTASQIGWGVFASFFVTAYEIYWDGIKIVQNGTLGRNSEDEIPGLYYYHSILPAKLLSTGTHTLILRISNYHDLSKWKWYRRGQVRIEPYAAEIQNIFRMAYGAFFMSGLVCIPFLFTLYLFVARKRNIEHLLFSLICFVVVVEYSIWHIPYFIDLPTTYIHWQSYLVRSLTVLLSILLSVFFVFLLSLPLKRIAVAAILLCNGIVSYLFLIAFWNLWDFMSVLLLIETSIISTWALLLRREGSIIIFTGFLLAWVAYLFGLWFIGIVSVTVIYTSLSLARQFVKKEKEEREAHLRSTRLENELLRKNITPHFLLNSLTLIIAWLRRDPKSAIKLIEMLADEFRMIGQIAALKQIPIQQEIDLCKTHLKIMNYRKGADYKLRTTGIEQEESVPPMIFHTLIENGLTHGYENKGKGVFTLERKELAEGIQYIISHDGNYSQADIKKSERFGMRYIKGRLEESYPNRWKISSRQGEVGWKTVIEIRTR
jgi:sensor histidine kinase YesM